MTKSNQNSNPDPRSNSDQYFRVSPANRQSKQTLPPSNDPLALIRKRELAQLLRVDPWTIDAWRKTGRIPPPIILSPQIVAWRRSDITLWLAQRETAPSATRKPNWRGKTSR
jgi:predicted DNA-binding transcriptional regulator AlpA